MHEYYRSESEHLRKDMRGYLEPVKEEIEEATKKGFEEILSETWECYEREMMENFPYIGGKKASGTRNLTGAYMFIALGVVMRRYGVPIERWGEISTVSYKRYFEKIPASIRRMVPRLLKHEKFVRKMLLKKDEKNRANSRENPGSFETLTPEPTDEYPIIYHTTHCPLASFAEKYGYTEFMPYICNLDYVMFGSLGLPFRRHKTIASGDEVCDFSFRPGAEVLPAWPCHVLSKDDDLK